MSAITVIILIVMLALGFVLCFFGCKNFRWLIGIYAGLLTGLAMYTFGLAMGWAAAPWIALAVGVAVAFLAYFFYVVGLFLTGLGFGFTLGGLLGALFGWPPMAWYSWVVCIVLGIVLGILMVKIRRVLIVLATSFFGADLMLTSIMTLAAGGQLAAGTSSSAISTIFSPQPLWGVLTLVVAIAGIVVQFVKTAPREM